MSDSNPAHREFLFKHWEGFRTELNDTVARYVELERNALVSTAAIWAWLAGITDASWHPDLKWLPFFLNSFFALRAFGLFWRTNEISNYLKEAEKHFHVPPELAIEQKYRLRNPKIITMWIFWLLLLLATAVLPLFYGPPTLSGRVWPA